MNIKYYYCCYQIKNSLDEIKPGVLMKLDNK